MSVILQVDVTRIVEPEDWECPDSLLWPDEVDDPNVEYMESLIKLGHKWDEKAWVGGDNECEKQRRPEEIAMEKGKKNDNFTSFLK